MDNLTHALSGLLLSGLLPIMTRSGDHGGISAPQGQKARVITILAASELPDLDVLASLGGELSYLQYHRGPSHSIIGLLLISMVLAGIMKVFFPRVKTIHLFGWGMLAGLLHVGLDLLNSYGTQVLYPWSTTRFAYDILMIVDPFLLLVLALGLVAAYRFRRRFSFSRVIRYTALIAVVYIGARVGIHSHLAGQVEQYLSREVKAQQYRVSVMPPLIGIREWDLVIDTPEEYLLGSVTWGSEPRITDRIEKPMGRPEVEAALATPPAREFLRFARYPHVIETPTDKGFQIQIVDLRYYSNGRMPFSIRLDLDHELGLIDYSLGS